MKKVQILGLLLLMNATLSVSAQKKAHVKGMAAWQALRNDSLRLVWMPSNATDWQKNNAIGYTLEKAELVKGQKAVFIKIHDTIKPLSLKEFKPKNYSDLMAMTAIYDDTLKSNSVQFDFSGRDAANQQNMRFLYASSIAFESHSTAIKMGLGYLETNMPKNKKFVYRLLTKNEKKKDIDTVYFQINTNKPTIVSHPPAISTLSQEKAVMLTWPAKKYIREFVMYHIERSEDGKQYERITKNPRMYTNTTSDISFLRDSLGVNYKPFFYRLVGMNHFGEWVISKMLSVGYGKDFTPPQAPMIDNAQHIGGSIITLSWTQKPENDLRGFYIERGNSLKGNYKRLNIMVPLAKTVFNYTDNNAVEKGTNHYRVVAVDTSGNESASLSAYVTMIDSIPPAPPKDVFAVTSDKGIVKISWTKSPENDIKGYYVYFANDPKHEFSQITKTLELNTSFADTITLRSLSEKVYYKVIAMDNHFNKSDFSEYYALKRPDIIPPVMPIITDLFVKDSSATIKWQKSPSSDVVEYKLYKREKGKEWLILKSFTGNQLNKYEYIDKNLVTNIVYEYCLEVIDDAGLKSERSPIRTARPMPAAKPKTSPVLFANYLKDKKTIEIGWNYQNNETYKVAVYRSDAKKQAFKLIGFSTSLEKTFIDKPTNEGNYKYMLQAIDANGISSEWSKEVTIKM